MKLLICTQKVDKNDPILGFFVGWIQEFAKHFDRIDVICLEQGEHNLPAHVHVHSLAKDKGASKLVQLWLFYRFFAKSFFTKPQYVFFHMGAIYNVLAAPFFLIRRVTGTQFYWWKAHGGTTRFEKIALWFVDRVYTPTENSFPVATHKKQVIGHAVDTDLFTLPAQTMNKHGVLFVGRIMPVKRLDIVLGIANEQGASVTVIGPVGDMAYKQSLDATIQQPGLEEKVQFVGGKTGEELVRAYQEAAVVVNPSETGSVDKVVLEAMACGTPVLAKQDTYAEILGQFGLTVEENDPALYVRQIEVASKVPPAELRSYVTEHHSLHTLPQRIFHIK